MLGGCIPLLRIPTFFFSLVQLAQRHHLVATYIYSQRKTHAPTGRCYYTSLAPSTVNCSLNTRIFRRTDLVRQGQKRGYH